MKKIIKKIFAEIFLERFFFHIFFLNILKKSFKKNYKVLELGAGKNSYIRLFDSKIQITALDIFKPSIQYAKEKGIYSSYIEGDARDLLTYVKPNTFDVVAAFDLIEHLSKEEGTKLINDMLLVAKKSIIVYTPNGFLPQPAFDDNPFQEHISGWAYHEMKEMGFKVYGINGLKGLRKMYAEPVIRPRFLGNFISNISMLSLKVLHREDCSFSLLCIRNIE